MSPSENFHYKDLEHLYHQSTNLEEKKIYKAYDEFTDALESVENDPKKNVYKFDIDGTEHYQALTPQQAKHRKCTVLVNERCLVGEGTFEGARLYVGIPDVSRHNEVFQKADKRMQQLLNQFSPLTKHTENSSTTTSNAVGMHRIRTIQNEKNEIKNREIFYKKNADAIKALLEEKNRKFGRTRFPEFNNLIKDFSTFDQNKKCKILNLIPVTEGIKMGLPRKMYAENLEGLTDERFCQIINSISNEDDFKSLIESNNYMDKLLVASKGEKFNVLELYMQISVLRMLKEVDPEILKEHDLNKKQDLVLYKAISQYNFPIKSLKELNVRFSSLFQNVDENNKRRQLVILNKIPFNEAQSFNITKENYETHWNSLSADRKKEVDFVRYWDEHPEAFQEMSLPFLKELNVNFAPLFEKKDDQSMRKQLTVINSIPFDPRHDFGLSSQDYLQRWDNLSSDETKMKLDFDRFWIENPNKFQKMSIKHLIDFEVDFSSLFKQKDQESIRRQLIVINKIPFDFCTKFGLKKQDYLDRWENISSDQTKKNVDPDRYQGENPTKTTLRFITNELNNIPYNIDKEDISKRLFYYLQKNKSKIPKGCRLIEDNSNVELGGHPRFYLIKE